MGIYVIDIYHRILLYSICLNYKYPEHLIPIRGTGLWQDPAFRGVLKQ